MPLSISKNKLTFLPDSAQQQCEYSLGSDIYVAAGAYHPLAPPIAIDLADECNHVSTHFHAHLPGVLLADLPDMKLAYTTTLGVDVIDVPGARKDGEVQSQVGFSQREPITSVELRLYPQSGKAFTIPSGTRIHLALQGNDSVLLVHPQTGAAPPTTEYFIIGYGANDPGKLNTFTTRIDQINAALPAGENNWVIASPSTVEKKDAIMAALDAWGAALVAGTQTTDTESALGWYTGTHKQDVAANVGALGGSVYIGLTRPVWNSGDWVFQDGTAQAHAHANWHNGPGALPNTEDVPFGNQATLYPSGGEYGNGGAAVGKFRGYNPWGVPATAIYERLA